MTKKDSETQEPLLPLHIEIGARREHEQREEDRMLYFPVNIHNFNCPISAIHQLPCGDDKYPVYLARSAEGEFQPSEGILLGHLDGEILRNTLPKTAGSVQTWEQYTL